MKFALLLTFWLGADGPAVHVIDYNLTGAECIAGISQHVVAKGPEYNGVFSCEADLGQPWETLTTAGVFAD